MDEKTKAVLEAVDDILTELNTTGFIHPRATGPDVFREESVRRIAAINGLRDLIGRPKIIDLLAPENQDITWAEAKRRITALEAGQSRLQGIITNGGTRGATVTEALARLEGRQEGIVP